MSTKRRIDPTKFVSNPGLQRVCKRAGVKRTSADVYPELRSEIVSQLDELIKNAMVSAENEGRNTIKYKDIEMAVHFMGKELAL